MNTKITDNKKPSNKELARRIERATLHLDKTKDTKEVFFDDRFLRLVVDETEGYALVGTPFHTHYFQMITSNGYSKPFIYVQAVVEIANKYKGEITTEKGVSFTLLQKLLQEKGEEARADLNIITYADWWFTNINAPLYSIGNDNVSGFLTFEQYIHNLARMETILAEKTEDVTQGQFIDNVCDKMKKAVENIADTVLYKKKTDKDALDEEIKALSQMQDENLMKE